VCSESQSAQKPVLGLPDYMAALYLHPADQVLKIDVLRGLGRMSFNIPVKVHHDKLDELADVPDLQRSLLRELSVFVTDLDGRVKTVLASARSESGIVVVAQIAGSKTMDTGLKTGDIIRAIGCTPLQTVSQLQAIVRELKPGDAVVLQVERNGKLQYISPSRWTEILNKLPFCPSKRNHEGVSKSFLGDIRRL
jgi:S1-C subfamily serine protease